MADWSFNPEVMEYYLDCVLAAQTVSFKDPFPSKQAGLIPHFMSELTIVSCGQKFDKSVIEIKFIHAMGMLRLRESGFWREINGTATIPAAKT